MNDAWLMTEDSFDIAQIGRNESLFSLGNGYLGFRGFLEERYPSYHPGVFINGFYDLEKITYGEEAYGFPKENQKMIDLPDIRGFRIMVDGEPMNIAEGTIHSYNRSLSMKEGILYRTVDWESEEGSRLIVRTEFLVSYSRQHLAAVHIEIEPITCNRVELVSSLSMPAALESDPDDPRVGSSSETHLEAGTVEWQGMNLYAGFSTSRSGKYLSCGAHVTDTVCDEILWEHSDFPEMILASVQNQPISCTKYLVYTDADDAESAAIALQSYMDEAADLRFAELKETQQQVLADFWDHSMVSCSCSPHMEKSIRFNLFELFQSVGKDGRTSLAAKGLTGAGYEGHYFWDTEIYGMPFFTYTQPKIARSLLEYRISTIPRAKQRAIEMHQKGILFPWRTINGNESSAYFPAGTAQYHINADIAYSLITYIEVTGDESILDEGGAELLFGTARFWFDIGFFNPRKDGAFCIHEVTGPDEYSALVNNNLYTNLMARYNLAKAAEYFAKRSYDALDFTEAEAASWKEAAQRMYIPFDETTGLHPQDDQFLDRERWDFENYPKENYPLLLHCHPLVIYRYQVIKQADVVLAHLLLPDEFSLYEKIRDFHYYEGLTTGDSSLSACIQGIIATEIGRMDLGLEYMQRTALVDLDDLQGNTKDGLHTASMGGSWMTMTYGLAGLRRNSGMLCFSPRVCSSVSSYSFTIQYHGVKLSVTVSGEKSTYECSGGDIILQHHGRELTVTDARPLTVDTIPTLGAVIFDLDGVITSTDDYHYQAWKQLSDEEGWKFDRAYNDNLRGVSRRESLELIATYNGIQLTDDAAALAMTDRKNGYYKELLQSLTPEDLLPGFLDLARDLKERGIRIGVASASRNAPFIIGKLGIAEFVDAIAPAGEVLIGKPDPEVFIRCAELLGVPVVSCIGVEDAEVGVQAIRAAGMLSVGIGESATDADIAVSGLEELELDELIESWKGQFQ